MHTLSSNFRAATRIVSEPLPTPGALPAGHILVRRAYAGAAPCPHSRQQSCPSAGSFLTAAARIHTIVLIQLPCCS